VAWFTEIPGAMRPIAWTAGPYNDKTCTYDQQKLWVATSSSPTAYRLNREDGTVEDQVAVPGVSYGYGGAADADGNFWIVSLGTDLARVDADDLSVTKWTIPHSVYAVTVASDGRVWMSANMSQTTSAIRFDPDSETFDLATGPVAYAQSGIAEDAEGRMWMNDWKQPYKIYPIDKDTMVTGQPFTVQGASSSAKGVSVDKDGNVWTAHFDDQAYRMDVDNDIVDIVTGLNYPYTYSDMTGGALTGVTCGSPTG
jgi:streptogramin lyase